MGKNNTRTNDLFFKHAFRFPINLLKLPTLKSKINFRISGRLLTSCKLKNLLMDPLSFTKAILPNYDKKGRNLFRFCIEIKKLE